MTTASLSPASLTTDRRHQPSPGRPVALENVRALLRGLDRRQRQAVTHGDGPLLVMAGPGTGKTEVITRRIAWLIASGRARPSEILALTFTERAADEMQARVDMLVPYGQTDTHIHTFHAFGDSILRQYGFEIGQADDPRVIGRSQAIVLLQDHIFELGLKRYLPLAEPTRFIGAMVDLFTRAKEEGLAPDDLAAYARELEAGTRAATDASESAASEATQGLLDEASAYAELAGAFGAYQALLMERGLVDHGDQVSQAVRLLEERAAVRMKLRRAYRYVVVDEAQDADPQQLRLLSLVVGKSGNIMFVGDDDQAIYSFRGAVGHGLARLEDNYQDVRDVVLKRNYRSHAPILAAARRLIEHNGADRLEVIRDVDKSLTAVRRARRPAMVTHRAFETAADEADHVAADIAARLRKGASPGSFAVLVRTNADAQPVLASLDVLRIPRRFSGASGLLAHQDVRDVLSLMRCINEPESSEDLYAVMASRAYGFGGAELTAVCERASRRRRTLWSVLTELNAGSSPVPAGLSDRFRGRIDGLLAELRSSMALAHSQPAPSVLYEHLRASGWLAALVSDAEKGDDGPIRRLARVFDLVREQSELVVDPRLAVVAPRLRALLDAGQDPEAPDAVDIAESVAVLTVHQAKGLEFPTVYVVGVAEGRFPVRGQRDRLSLPEALVGHGSRSDPEAHRAEERRLFYVAMTRARDELLLSHACRGSRGGRRRRPSTFLAEALGREADDMVTAARPMASPIVVETPTPGAEEPARKSRKYRASALDLSYTQIDDYLSCPLKYRLRHLVHVPAPANHALSFGSAMHRAVAAVNRARSQEQPVKRDEVVAVLDASWSSDGYVSQEHEAARYAAGRAALDRFIDRAEGSEGERIIAVEAPFSVRIEGTRVRGRYDAITESSAGRVITDYKTGDLRDPVKARQRARASLQLHLYGLAHAAETGSVPTAVELHFLEGDVVGRVGLTERQLDSARSKIVAAAAGIREGAFDATPGYPTCDWCPYRRICPASP